MISTKSKVPSSYDQLKLVVVTTIFKTRTFLSLFLLLAFFNSCKKDPAIIEMQMEEGNEVFFLPIPSYFPYPIVPMDNQFTKNRIDLGKKLFFDPILSRDGTISCASCHEENRFFTDNLPISIGIEGRMGIRNSPSLINVAYQPNMFWDGGNPTLEQQILAPIVSHFEMDFDVNKVVDRLKKHTEYSALFQKAYNQAPSVFSLTRAIACYERTLIGGTSRYDKYIQKIDTLALNRSEKNGMSIFFGENGECFHCHQGFNFTDYSFRNNGLYITYPDSGRARITELPQDVGKFKVPSLRNIEKTAPYMHDGSLNTLEEVINHYESGGAKHPNKSPIIQPLKLSKQEKIDLVNFLKSLTDE